MEERITDYNVWCCLACYAWRGLYVTRTQQPLALFLSLSLIYLFALQALPAPTSLCRHRHVQQNKRRSAFGVPLFIHDALQSACPFQVLFRCFCLGFFCLEQWLAQTDFHIKNRGGGDAYVWGAAICALMLATVSWLMWKTKYSFFSVFLFFFSLKQESMQPWRTM